MKMNFTSRAMAAWYKPKLIKLLCLHCILVDNCFSASSLLNHSLDNLWTDFQKKGLSLICHPKTQEVTIRTCHQTTDICYFKYLAIYWIISPFTFLYCRLYLAETVRDVGSKFGLISGALWPCGLPCRDLATADWPSLFLVTLLPSNIIDFLIACSLYNCRA